MTEHLSEAIKDIQGICDRSNQSRLFVFGSSGYKDSLRHWLDSSSQRAEAAVQPGTVQDLSEIMVVLARRKVPFGIKGGGHATSPGMSSTTGIQIYMAQFNQVRYDSATQTLDVGAGCLWDEVYPEILKRKRNVVGGAVLDGVGVAGWLLGGGYSWRTRQHGLGVDNIVKFQVVLPSGKVIEVDENDGERSDIFRALKGGGNNFGIVTRFTLKTHEQGVVYGGIHRMQPRDFTKIKSAIVDFVQKEKRPQASILTAFRHALEDGNVVSTITVQCFFDGRKPPNDPFEAFHSIAGKPWEPKTAAFFRGARVEPMAVTTPEVGEMSYTELDAQFSGLYDISEPDVVQLRSLNNQVTTFAPETAAPPAMGGVGEMNSGGRFACIMVSSCTEKLVDAMSNQANLAAGMMKDHKGLLVVVDFWPVLPDCFDNRPHAAWKRRTGEACGLLLVFFRWRLEAKKKFWLDEMERVVDALRSVALDEKCTYEYSPTYLNTSLESVSPKEIYRESLDELGVTRAKYDPEDVMSRAGGFKIPLVKS